MCGVQDSSLTSTHTHRNKRKAARWFIPWPSLLIVVFPGFSLGSTSCTGSGEDDVEEGREGAVNLSTCWEIVLQRPQGIWGPDQLYSGPVQLSEWWLKTAYLQFRQPVVIYSSPGVILPKQDFVDLQGQLR